VRVTPIRSRMCLQLALFCPPLRTDLLPLCSDQVSDAILDACLAEDPLSKVNASTLLAGRDSETYQPYF